MWQRRGGGGGGRGRRKRKKEKEWEEEEEEEEEDQPLAMTACHIASEREEKEGEEEEEEEERSLVGRSNLESPSLLLTSLFYPSRRPHHSASAPSPGGRRQSQALSSTSHCQRQIHPVFRCPRLPLARCHREAMGITWSLTVNASGWCAMVSEVDSRLPMAFSKVLISRGKPSEAGQIALLAREAAMGPKSKKRPEPEEESEEEEEEEEVSGEGSEMEEEEGDDDEVPPPPLTRSF